MADTSNVIDVDFRARLDPDEAVRADVRGLLDLDPVGTLDRVIYMLETLGRERDFWRDAWKDQARRRRRLERELRAREYATFTFSDGDVAAALPATPVRASALAERMFPGRQVPHGIVVRIGQALSRLEHDGRTRRRDRRGDGYRYGFEWEAVASA